MFIKNNKLFKMVCLMQRVAQLEEVLVRVPQVSGRICAVAPVHSRTLALGDGPGFCSCTGACELPRDGK